MRHLQHIYEYRYQLELPFDSKAHPLHDKMVHIHVQDALKFIRGKTNPNQYYSNSNLEKIFEEAKKEALKKYKMGVEDDDEFIEYFHNLYDNSFYRFVDRFPPKKHSSYYNTEFFIKNNLDIKDLYDKDFLYNLSDTDDFDVNEFVADYLYQELIKAVPEFKDFQFSKTEDVWTNLREGKIGMHLQNLKKLSGTRFNAESELWLYYHLKSNQIFDYKKGKIYVLFIAGLRPTKKSFSLMPEPGNSEKDNDARQSENEMDNDARQAFGDMVKSRDSACKGKSCGEEFDDNKFDGFLKKLSDVLSGHPDKEDEALYYKLKIKHNNLSFPTFFKTLPKIQKNLVFFKRYLKSKYNLVF